MSTESPPLHPGPRYTALLQLLRITENLWDCSRLFFGRWQLSPSQFNLLNLLRAAPEGLSQTELSRELIMHRSNITGLVDRLEARKLVTRKENPLDRRVYQVVLTAAGAQLIKTILPDYYMAAEKVWGEITPGRAAQMIQQLEKLTQNARSIVGGGEG